jgi:hypothetical protein
MIKINILATLTKGNSMHRPFAWIDTDNIIRVEMPDRSLPVDPEHIVSKKLRQLLQQIKYRGDNNA